jgi:hypothetical protein
MGDLSQGDASTEVGNGTPHPAGVAIDDSESMKCVGSSLRRRILGKNRYRFVARTSRKAHSECGKLFSRHYGPTFPPIMYRC